jgi:hypothetical protein
MKFPRDVSKRRAIKTLESLGFITTSTNFGTSYNCSEEESSLSEEETKFTLVTPPLSDNRR